MINLIKSAINYIRIFYLCKKYKIKKFSIKNGLVNVNGDVRIRNKKKGDLSALPIQFGEVTGNFDCSSLGLTTLKGSPTSTGGSFGCGGNKLISLEGSPKFVGRNFNCMWNALESLEFCPEYVGGNFNSSYCNLRTLKGVESSKIDGNLECNNNPLTTIEYIPHNVQGNYDFSNNNIYTFDSYPDNSIINNKLHMRGNPIYEIIHNFQTEKVNHNYLMESLKENNPCRPDGRIVWIRFEQVYKDLDLWINSPDTYQFRSYKMELPPRELRILKPHDPEWDYGNSTPFGKSN